MKEKIDRLYKLFFNKQFLIFVMIGCINTLSTTVFSTLYTRLLDSISSFILGYLTGIIISYTLNTIFTFQEEWNVKRLVKFGLSTIPNFIIQLIIVYIGTNIMYLPNIICYAIAAIIGVPVTFLILKVWVFVRK